MKGRKWTALLTGCCLLVGIAGAPITGKNMSLVQAKGEKIETKNSAEVYRLSQPNGLFSTNEALYVMDGGNNVIYQLQNGKMKQIIGKQGSKDIYGFPQGDYHDASVSDSYFQEPYDMVPFMDGYAISDVYNNTIRYVKNGKVYTAGGAMAPGYMNAKGVYSRFYNPKGLAVDEEGSLYIADSLNHVIRKMDLQGNVTTYAGTREGYADGEILSAAFCEPAGLDWYEGALYVADSGNHCIRKIENGMVTTVAGGNNPRYEQSKEKAGGFQDGALKTALFDSPEGVLVRNGIIYVADTGNSAFRKIEDYTVTTIEQLINASESIYPSEPTALTFYDGKLYGSDRFSGIVYVLEEDRWKAEIEKELTPLLMETNQTFKTQTEKITLTEEEMPILIKSQASGVIPITPQETGMAKITIYRKEAKGMLTFSTDEEQLLQLAQISMEQATYDEALNAYYLEVILPCEKGQPLYLSASQGGYAFSGQIYRTGDRQIKAEVEVLTPSSEEERAVYYKYKATKTELVTIEVAFLNWRGEETEMAEISLCDSKKKSTNKKIIASSQKENTQNQLVFKVEKDKIYYIKVSSAAAYRLNLQR